MPVASPNPQSRSFSRPAPGTRGDWSAHVATALDRVADLVADLNGEGWMRPTVFRGWPVSDVVRYLVHRIEEPPRGLHRLASRRILRAERPRWSPDDTEVPRDRDALVALLRQLSAEKLRSGSRAGIDEIAAAVVLGCAIEDATGSSLRLSPRSSGAVALARLGSPLMRFGRQRTLRATDALWQIGTGPVIDASAAAIVLDVYGLKPLEESSASDPATTPAED